MGFAALFTAAARLGLQFRGFYKILRYFVTGTARVFS